MDMEKSHKIGIPGTTYSIEEFYAMQADRYKKFKAQNKVEFMRGVLGENKFFQMATLPAACGGIRSSTQNRKLIQLVEMSPNHKANKKLDYIGIDTDFVVADASVTSIDLFDMNNPAVCKIEVKSPDSLRTQGTIFIEMSKTKPNKYGEWVEEKGWMKNTKADFFAFVMPLIMKDKEPQPQAKITDLFECEHQTGDKWIARGNMTKLEKICDRCNNLSYILLNTIPLYIIVIIKVSDIKDMIEKLTPKKMPQDGGITEYHTIKIDDIIDRHKCYVYLTPDKIVSSKSVEYGNEYGPGAYTRSLNDTLWLPATARVNNQSRQPHGIVVPDEWRDRLIDYGGDSNYARNNPKFTQMIRKSLNAMKILTISEMEKEAEQEEGREERKKRIVGLR